MDAQPLYLRIAQHYRGAIRTGALLPGERMPSVRHLMRLHQVSLSTALQTCRHLEGEGLLEARPRSGYFVQPPRRTALQRPAEPDAARAADPAQYVGVHARVSRFVEMSEQSQVAFDFGAAIAAPAAYPVEPLKLAALRTLRHQPELLVRQALSAGELPLRNALARRALDSGMRITADDIVVTQGCIEALTVALRAVAEAGDTVAVESPTYYGLLQVLESLGLRALEVPASPSTGLSIEALELALRTHPSIKAVVVSPNFQNPLGTVMPDAHKARLVALCETEQVPLVEDDTYAALGDDPTPMKTLKGWDTSGNVIHCASLRKTLAPGMRLGWISGGRWHARVRMLKYAQSRANDALAQLTAADFMATSAYDRHLNRLRQQLKRQREATAEAIAAHFPEGTRLTVPDGSLLLWVELPPGTSADAALPAALAEGIRFVPGSLFSNTPRFERFMRIGCGQPMSREVDAALRRLATIVGVAG